MGYDQTSTFSTFENSHGHLEDQYIFYFNQLKNLEWCLVYKLFCCNVKNSADTYYLMPTSKVFCSWCSYIFFEIHFNLKNIYQLITQGS